MPFNKTIFYNKAGFLPVYPKICIQICRNNVNYFDHFVI